jgi:metal-responsive CopG/Arc/MetJ family transcriptional regulator
MQQITLRVDEDVLDEIEQEAEEAGVSRSEHIREVLRTRNEHDEIRTEYEERIESLETELDRAQRRTRQVLEQKEERDELIRYVEQERSLQEDRVRAGIVTRAKWFLVGREE